MNLRSAFLFVCALPVFAACSVSVDQQPLEAEQPAADTSSAITEIPDFAVMYRWQSQEGAYRTCFVPKKGSNGDGNWVTTGFVARLDGSSDADFPHLWLSLLHDGKVYTAEVRQVQDASQYENQRPVRWTTLKSVQLGEDFRASGKSLEFTVDHKGEPITFTFDPVALDDAWCNRR